MLMSVAAMSSRGKRMKPSIRSRRLPGREREGKGEEEEEQSRVMINRGWLTIHGYMVRFGPGRFGLVWFGLVL